MMGDECSCEKCRANPAEARREAEWQVERSEAQSDVRGRTEREQFLFVGERGIAIR